MTCFDRLRPALGAAALMVSVLCLVLLLAPGCTPNRDEPSTAGEPDSVAAESEAPHAPDLQGAWVVIGHRIPGVSAMSDDDAAAWHGRVLHVGANRVAFGTDSCAAPTYRSQVVPADSLLGIGYHATPSQLGITATGSTLEMVQVYCGAAPWVAPGGVLLRLPEGKVYTVWNGVFFELGRVET